ncbi:hypothetical protein DUI87_29730 [Hirundo rustica rustica]|uniref:Uncharacterized protein n=1 Tax=Hirundo rustica rustica TaxID=333673 RepID=A0A3M0IZH3_HIRRU|nr:hypothetical protein DUI87_29730 [Hirundo rustica rustica]
MGDFYDPEHPTPEDTFRCPSLLQALSSLAWDASRDAAELEKVDAEPGAERCRWLLLEFSCGKGALARSHLVGRSLCQPELGFLAASVSSRTNSRSSELPPHSTWIFSVELPTPAWTRSESWNGLAWKEPQSSSSATDRDTFHDPRVLQTPSSLAWDTSRDGAATVSLDKLFLMDADGCLHPAVSGSRFISWCCCFLGEDSKFVPILRVQEPPGPLTPP